MKRDWMYWSLFLAGIYNLIWGAYIVLFPTHFFNFLGLKVPHYIEFWQCIGMIVGVYGIGYICAAQSPIKFWPIVLVGFLGKIFGPIGFIQAIVMNDFPVKFGYTIITNDLIWWAPFGVILYKSWQTNNANLKERIYLSIEDIQSLPDRKRATFINSLSGYKSANLIATTSENNSNLCIVSSVFHLGANPALIGFIIRPDSVPRDTLNNLRSTKKCTLNHVNKEIYQRAHQTSARYPSNTSEFSSCGLTEEYIDNFEIPFVKESNIKMSLEIVREEKLKENGTHFIIAKIKGVYLPRVVMGEDGFVDIAKAKTIAVSGLDCYNEAEILGRLSYAKPDRPLSFID